MGPGARTGDTRPVWTGRTEAARREIAALATSGVGVGELHTAALAVVARLVPFDQACWAVLDPASLVMTGVTNWPPWPVGAELEARFAESEASGTEPNGFGELAGRPVPVARSSDLPPREAARSVRLNDLLRPLGYEHEVRAVFRVDGAVWAVGGLFRSPGTDFSARELEFLASVAPVVAAATRVAVCADLRGSAEPDGPVIVLAGPRGELRAATAAAARWLAELEDAAPGRFGLTLHAVVAGARVATTGTARARMRDARGGWVVLQASRLLAGDEPGQMVITVEPVTGSQLTDLQFVAYALTPREQDVCLEVLAGHPTGDIAARLSISANTVQDHLKAVFRKVGVNSRGELAARLRTGV